MRIVILGPPVSGKSTQACILVTHMMCRRLRFEDVLRETAPKNTLIGRTIKGSLQRGELVLDKIVNDVVEGELEQLDTEKDFVLDGYPQDIDQAEALDRIFQDRGDPGQRLGLGKNLADSIVGVAEDKRLEMIYGYVMKDNTRMLELCRKMGFKIKGESVNIFNAILRLRVAR